MKKYKYIGTFKSAEGNNYQLTVFCNGFIEAFFLLTADAIRTGKHYQLYSIEDCSNSDCRYVCDILNVGELILK
jgi:hypothetical protein